MSQFNIIVTKLVVEGALKISQKAVRYTLTKPFGIARGEKTEVESLEVRLSENGFIGTGEATPYPRYGESIAKSLNELENLPEQISEQNLLDLLEPGATRNAVDLALLELRAKQQDSAVWQMLGLPEPKPLEFISTVSLQSTEKMIAEAQQKSSSPILKIKLGGKDDATCMAGIRESAPSSRLIVDVNEGWSKDQLEKLLPVMVEAGVELIEQPLPEKDDDFLKNIQSPIPLCADESVYPGREIQQLGEIYQVINLKLDKSGGLSELLKQLKQCRELGLGVMVGCMVSGSMAIAPAFYAGQLADYADLDGFLHLQQDRPNGLIVENGMIWLEPGLWGS